YSSMDVFRGKSIRLYRVFISWFLEMGKNLKSNDDGSTQDRMYFFIFKLKVFPGQTPLRFSVGYETADRLRPERY
ncbi:MAG: hypothetical protein L6416_06800, partial [Candidatus Omnitrophica bacterium]|nr:hypothetical protein [Candidatus Omnitrophota bacterium]